MRQHTAIKHTATHCNTLQHTATHTLRLGGETTREYTAIYCNVLQHCNKVLYTATHCNTLQHTATFCNTRPETGRQRIAHALFQHLKKHCKTLQQCNILKQTAIHCNNPPTHAHPRNTATYCNTRQHTATPHPLPTHPETGRQRIAHENLSKRPKVCLCVCARACMCMVCVCRMCVQVWSITIFFVAYQNLHSKILYIHTMHTKYIWCMYSTKVLCNVKKYKGTPQFCVMFHYIGSFEFTQTILCNET